MIGIIGYGRFGRLTARYFSEIYPVVVFNRSEIVEKKRKRIRHAALEEVCRQAVVVLCVPISHMRDLLKQIAPLLGRDALVVDVCSVKTQPVRWMEEALPPSVSILATHPMFGPDSAADALSGHKIVLCPVRIDTGLFNEISKGLSEKGLVVLEATPEEHDRQIAVTLALTHFIGRSLAKFGADDLPIDTEGYKRLRHILGVVENDTWQLFKDMHAFNPYAKGIREEFIGAMQQIDSQLS